MSDEENTTTPNEAEEEVNANNSSDVDEEPPKPVAPTIKQSNKTQKQMVKDSKQRAIDNFNKGIVDPEWRVVKMSNGKYRTYKRKEPLAPTPINVNQVAANKPRKEIMIEDDDDEPVVVRKGKHKAEHDPMQDVMYYNLNNQINEQLNKRLDSINQEIERLRNKNTKLKNKYKNLKQAIFITEDEEAEEPTPQPQHEEPTEQQQQQDEQPRATVIPIKRRTAIDFNQFF